MSLTWDRRGEFLFACDRVLLASMGAGVLVTGTGTTHLSCWDKPYHPASVPALLAGPRESSFLLVQIPVLYWVGSAPSLPSPQHAAFST